MKKEKLKNKKNLEEGLNKIKDLSDDINTKSKDTLKKVKNQFKEKPVQSLFLVGVLTFLFGFFAGKKRSN